MSNTCTNESDVSYTRMIARMQSRFEQNLAEHNHVLFTTDATGLWDAFLDSMPPARRQYHTCHACRHFIERFGGLVTIDNDGRIWPAFFDPTDADEEYIPAFDTLGGMVVSANIMGVFLSAEAVLGQHVTHTKGEWHHFALTQPNKIRYKGVALNAAQKMAERVQDFETVRRALHEWPTAVLETAVTLLRSDALYRSEKVLGQAEWLLNLHITRNNIRNRAYSDALLWRAIALAPAGFCHPRTSMIGTLCDDLASGKSLDAAAASFAAKMHPLSYQRPQTAPTAGNIAAGETLVAKLGIQRSLLRRFARLDEIETIWKPTQKDAVTDGVFGHLKPKDTTEVSSILTSEQKVSWLKFERDVLPHATAISCLVPSVGSFCALVTAEDLDAPPILQWDRVEQRNPVSWYVYNGGSYAANWSLRAGAWVKVNALTLNPPFWFNNNPSHESKSILAVLDGCKDQRESGLALFPETLRSELREIRATIEAYSRNGTLSGRAEASAQGLLLGRIPATLRVTQDSLTMTYTIDRWE